MLTRVELWRRSGSSVVVALAVCLGIGVSCIHLLAYYFEQVRRSTAEALQLRHEHISFVVRAGPSLFYTLLCSVGGVQRLFSGMFPHSCRSGKIVRCHQMLDPQGRRHGCDEL